MALLDDVYPQLRSADPDQRREAVHALGASDDPRAGDTLIAMLDDPDTRVLHGAVVSLAKLNYHAAGEPLRAMLPTSHGRLRSLLVDTLSELGITEAIDQAVMAYVQHLANPNEHIEGHECYECGLLIPALERYGTALIPSLLAVVQRQKHPHPDLVTLLGHREDPRVEESLVQLARQRTQPIETRCAAIDGLRDPRSLPHLLALFADPSEAHDVQASVIYTLASMATDDAAAPLIARLHDPHTPLWQRMLIGVLAKEPTFTGAREALAVLLHDSVRPLALRAATSLATLRDHRAYPVLMDAIQSEVGTEREQAADALGDLGDPRALPAIQKLAAHDPIRDVRRAAERAIAKLQAEARD